MRQSGNTSAGTRHPLRKAGKKSGKYYFWFLPTLFIFLTLVTIMGGCSRPAASTPAPTTPSATPSSIAPSKIANPEIIMASTTSTGDSGLMDVLVPLFEQKTGYKVKPIYVGTGQALVMGERGEADVLLVHAPDSEVKFMEAGHGINRKLVMHNDFIIVGPAADPAGIKGLSKATEAFKKIADTGALFISRGDNSGTDQLEKKLWKQLGIDPEIPAQRWYQETGQGMGATLNIAAEKAGYTLTDRATFLATQKNTGLVAMVEGDPLLLNIYHVIQINPKKSNKINTGGAKAFVDFMVDPETQEIIGKFGIEKYGQPLFFPDAGKTEKEIGSDQVSPSS